VIEALDPDERESVRQQVAEEVEPLVRDGSATGTVHIVRAMA
jgi:hypothetical protein